MFVYNVKVNKSNVFKVFIVGIIILCFLFFGFKYISGKSKVKDTIDIPDLVNIDSNNYTNVLKTVHDNLDPYIGQRIKFTGYIYRVSDIKKDEFVLARDMVINANNQTVVVGFLCEYKNASNFKEGTWIEASGTIKKGEYHGDIPIIQIDDIKEVARPNEPLVYPPEDSYLPTSAIL